jgi:glyoxylase-like metal-dependent hydrolase (beta-lactamase superfamily II)
MFEEVGEGVFRRRYESLDLNIGVVVGNDGLLIVDTRASHGQADQLREELARLSALPVRWVVNTHWHWDHSFGNACFHEAEIWGHELCREALTKRGEEMKAGAKEWLPADLHTVIDEVEIVPPAKTFSDTASLHIGKAVEMSYHGLAHTDADIVISIPDSGVAFMGDLVEESAPPSFGDSFPVLWPLTLSLAMTDVPDVIVPGHGDVVDRAFVRSQHEELVAVAELATMVIGGEVGIEEAVGLGPYPAEVMRSALERAAEVASAELPG